MDDDELLEALRTALDAADPPPASVTEDALRAHSWGGSSESQAEPRPQDALAGAGMRGQSGEPQDHSFAGGNHDIDLTVEPTVGAEFALSAVVTPPVVSVALISPFGEPVTSACDAAGRVSFVTSHRLIALEFEGSSGAMIRTPLIDLRTE